MLKISTQYFGGRGGAGSGGARGGRGGGSFVAAQASWSTSESGSRAKFNKELKSMMTNAAVGDTITVTQTTKAGTYTNTFRKMEPGSTYKDPLGDTHTAKAGETWAWTNQGRDGTYERPVSTDSATSIIRGTGNTGSFKVTAATVQLRKNKKKG